MYTTFFPPQYDGVGAEQRAELSLKTGYAESCAHNANVFFHGALSYAYRYARPASDARATFMVACCNARGICRQTLLPQEVLACSNNCQKFCSTHFPIRCPLRPRFLQLTNPINDRLWRVTSSRFGQAACGLLRLIVARLSLFTSSTLVQPPQTNNMRAALPCTAPAAATRSLCNAPARRLVAARASNRFGGGGEPLSSRSMGLNGSCDSPTGVHCTTMVWFPPTSLLSFRVALQEHVAQS